MKPVRAAWELLQSDDTGGPVRNAVVGAHNVIANAPRVLTAPLSQNQFQVVDRAGDFDGIINATRNALRARWFEKGNPLNVVPKAIEAITGLTDGLISDVLHFGAAKNGKVIRTIQ